MVTNDLNKRISIGRQLFSPIENDLDIYDDIKCCTSILIRAKWSKWARENSMMLSGRLSQSVTFESEIIIFNRPYHMDHIKWNICYFRLTQCRIHYLVEN